MNDLLTHGGIDRWNKFKKVTATYVGLNEAPGMAVSDN